MDVLGAVRAHLGRHFDGMEPQVASVTFLGLPAIEVLRFVDGDLVHYATLGCAANPMTDPAAAVADPVRGPRAELVLTLRGGVGGVVKPLAVLAATPAVEGVVLRPDALLDLGEPLWDGAVCTAVLLAESEVPDLALASPYEPVRFLRAAPVTATEAAWVRLRGAAALREAWREADIDLRDPRRAAAGL